MLLGFGDVLLGFVDLFAALFPADLHLGYAFVVVVTGDAALGDCYELLLVVLLGDLFGHAHVVLLDFREFVLHVA